MAFRDPAQVHPATKRAGRHSESLLSEAGAQTCTFRPHLRYRFSVWEPNESMVPLEALTICLCKAPKHQDVDGI